MLFLFLIVGAGLAGAQLKPITTFTAAGTTLRSAARMFLYEPANLPADPPIVVGIHYCGGSAQNYYNSNPKLHTLADQKKFPVIYPESPNSCWDVSSPATLKRNGGADSHAVAEMVRWAKNKYGGGKGVFVIGESSGGMMAVSGISTANLGWD
jgi:acetylxylan esterase